MADTTVSCRLHVASADSDELRVPADLLGDDAELEVGPGPVVTIGHSWQAVEDSVVITIRRPSTGSAREFGHPTAATS